VHEVYLDHSNGPRAEISADIFAILEAVDGVRSLASLATVTGELGAGLRRELHELWQGRYFRLRPDRL
jgi:decarbamoylnovobiocin carbamoyltransferase/7-O-carbamoyltransferase